MVGPPRHWPAGGCRGANVPDVRIVSAATARKSSNPPVHPPNPPAAGRSLVAEARSPHAPRSSADPPAAESICDRANIACAEPGFAGRPQAGAAAVSAATARQPVIPPNPPAAGRSLVAEARSPHAPRSSADPPAPRAPNATDGGDGVKATPTEVACEAEASRSPASPGDRKPEQPLCRLRRREMQVRSSLAWSRASPGDRKPEQPLCRLRRRERPRESQLGGSSLIHPVPPAPRAPDRHGRRHGPP
jgi:hypothetical protein